MRIRCTGERYYDYVYLLLYPHVYNTELVNEDA